MARHNFLRYAFYPFGSEWRFVDGEGKPASVEVSGNLLTSSAEVLRAATLRGLGIFLAPGFIVGGDLAAGALGSQLPEYRPVEFAINAIYPHRHLRSAKVRAFIDLLSERAVEHRQWMNPDIPCPVPALAGRAP